MNKITMHIPNYVFAPSLIPEEYEFDGIQQLLEIDFVKEWSTTPDFYRYSQGKSFDTILLMCESNKGKDWWVIGYLAKPVNLPKWEPIKGNDDE